jgi:predicted nucleic acid-binding protein
VPKYALDTNVYITAGGTPTATELLKQFFHTHHSRTFLNAVIVQELRAGARTPGQVSALEHGVIHPFMRRGRVFTPSARAFQETGRILADLITRDVLEYADTKRSLVSDLLIATSCREHGIVLITTDRNFDRIGRHLKGLQSVKPFPS